jgi:hypothetical protein
MKGWVWNGMLAAAIALPALSGAAREQRTDNDGCSNATLQGDYAFSVLSIFPAPGNVVVGIGRFDGKGGFAQIDYPGDRLRTAGTLDFRTGQTGSYSVNPDCTGSQEIDLNVLIVPPGTSHGVIHNAFVISNGGRSIHGVVAEITSPGATSPAPSLTRVDFWKVESELDE